MSILIYGAGPIDLGTDCQGWRNQLIKALETKGMPAVMFDPSTAYKTSLWGHPCSDRSGYIEEVNRCALITSSVFVVCLPKNVQSIGTPIELDWANKACKPIFMMTDIERGKSVYLDNRVPETNWLLVPDFNNPEDIDHTINFLANILVVRVNAGEIVSLP